jgi:putative hydrolase of the HAD superfamily
VAAIRTIFFDAVGTLIHPASPVGETYARIGRHYGADVSQGLAQERFRAAFRRQEELDAQQSYRTSEERERARWQDIVAEVFHDQPDPTGPLAELWHHFAGPDAWTCFPDVLTSLPVLRERGLALGIASNFDSRLRSIVAGSPALQPCQLLVISSEVGWRKPAPAFFAMMIAAAGRPAGEILLVGDDVGNDYDGGRRAGLATVLLDRRSDRDAEAALHSLSELAGWLESQR